MTPTKYRKKPIEVTAVQWTGDNEAELTEFTGHQFSTIPRTDRVHPEVTAEVYDKLHKTWVGVKDGQSVIKGVKGEFYPIDADVLAETYEPVASDVQQKTPEPAQPAPRCATCAHVKSDHSDRQDHRKRHPMLTMRPWCHACEATCDYQPDAA